MRPRISAKSRLYHLKPVGVGTPYVECLSGYAARLAEQHSTTLYYVFSREIAPLIQKPGTINLSVSFASFAKAVNGLGTTAADLVEVLGRLTLRRDLRLTTMLPWAGAISSKKLTRERRAWCAECYEEGIDGERVIYDQLIWTVQCVTCCVKHKRRLEHECPHCGRPQLHLSYRSRPGFCARCRGWLGLCPRSKKHLGALRLVETTEEELTTAEEVGKLLAAAPDMPSGVKASALIIGLQSFAGKWFAGRGVPSRFELPADKQTVRSWLRGTQTPSLPLLLKTLLILDISPADLLLKHEDNLSKSQVDEATREKGHENDLHEAGGNIVPSPSVEWKNSECVKRVELRLRAALNEYPPSSLTKISKELGCTRGTLRKKFPELSAQVAEVANAYYGPCIGDEKILEALLAALKEDPPPPLQEVSRRLGAGASIPILHKKFPKESRGVVERYGVSKKRRLDNVVLEEQLRMALNRTPPPSMPEVSRELKVARATLHRKFPALAKAISSRFAVHRRWRDARNREEAKAEIKSICERVLSEGRYPDSATIRSQLSVPCQSAAFSKAWREALAELGHTFSSASGSENPPAKSTLNGSSKLSAKSMDKESRKKSKG